MIEHSASPSRACSNEYLWLTWTDKPQCTCTATGVQFLQKLYRSHTRFVKVCCHSYAFMTRYCKLLYGVVNAYTRGAVEVLYAGAVWCCRGMLVVRSRYAHGAVEVRSCCSRGTLVVQSKYASGAVEVHSRYVRGAVEVRSWYGLSMRYIRGALPVRCVSLTFHRAICTLKWFVYRRVAARVQIQARRRSSRSSAISARCRSARASSGQWIIVELACAAPWPPVRRALF